MKPIFIFWVILFLPSIFFAQVENKQLQWTTIESPKGEFSFSIPPDFLIDNEDGEYRAIAYQNETVIRVSIQESGRAKDRLKAMRQFPAAANAKVSHFTLGDFIGDAYNYENENGLSMSFEIASSKAFYTVSVFSKNSGDSATNFLHSIKLDDKPVIKQDSQTIEKKENKISIASLKTSSIVIESLKRKDAVKPEIKYDLDDKNASSDKFTPEADTTKYSRPLIILRKPRANFTDSARENHFQGTIKFKVLFGANGEIGEIVVLSQFDKGLVKNSVDALRRMKFIPAEVDGKPVDVSKMVEYSFNIN